MGIALLATVLTGILAWPVLRAPDRRVFGVPLVGTHHDPFTMMQVWERQVTSGVVAQPVTDVPGRRLAAAAGPVAAYNWIVLLTFPLAAVAAFALARHLAIPRGGAALAAFAFAFSPFHLAHAAYHPHIAQVQWIPIYVLALWSALARGTVVSLLGLVLATMAVTLSNFYGGWIMAVLTPFLLLAGWAVVPARVKWMPVLSLLVIVAVCGLVYVAWAAPSIWEARASAGVPSTEIATYSARPIAYVVPPAAHPLLGAAVTRFWHGAGVTAELLEQQVSLGWGIVALAVVAIGAWFRRSSATASALPLRAVPALVAIGGIAAVLSAAPGLITGSGLYAIAPMFSAYARFGVVTHLMLVLLAGMGYVVLRQRATAGARWLGAALVLLVVAEYIVVPTAASRDVWPTAAHRWVHDHPTGLRVLDCMPYADRTASDPWLTRGRIQLLGGSFPDCAEPHLAAKLSALGFTHVLVRAGADDAGLFEPGQPTPGLVLVQRDQDASLWQVTAPLPAIFVDTMSGLLPRERDQERSWRWMQARAEWRIMNPGPTPIHATLRLEASSFARPRVIVVALNETVVQQLTVSQERDVYVIGPLLVPRGHHVLTFESGGPDGLSIAFGGWRWTTTPEVQ
jgi:hypothetical protein